MDAQQARDLVELLDEVLWKFGGQSPEGYCCEDVSYVEYRALRIVARAETCAMQNIGQQLGFTKSGATRIIDRLERKGYAQRERYKEDHRVCCVTLTDAGRFLVERIVEDFSRKTGASLELLDEDMRNVLLASLRSFVRAFCS
ncbi:MAG: MarR family winged helix-turn-helix transcriptional regulator [Candidatus Xenobiia bacterium LiM19]